MFTYSRILLPTDFSHCSFYAMRYAEAFARRYGAELHLVHVVDTVQLLAWASPSYWLSSHCLYGRDSCLCERAEARLRHLVHLMRRDGIEAEAHVLRGTPTVEIANLAREMDCELVVVGTHGRVGMEHALIGSVAETVARHSPAPVLTIKHPERDFVEFDGSRMVLRRVMFPTDFSPFSRAALPYAASLCREFDATLVLFHSLERVMYGGELAADSIVSVFPDEREGREQLETLAAEFPGVDVQIRQETGSASHRIVQAVEDLNVDLVVIPTHGRTGVARLLFGSVAEKVLRFASCPVLTVRPDMAPVKKSAKKAATAAHG